MALHLLSDYKMLKINARKIARIIDSNPDDPVVWTVDSLLAASGLLSYGLLADLIANTKFSVVDRVHGYRAEKFGHRSSCGHIYIKGQVSTISPRGGYNAADGKPIIQVTPLFYLLIGYTNLATPESAEMARRVVFWAEQKCAMLNSSKRYLLNFVALLNKHNDE